MAKIAAVRHVLFIAGDVGGARVLLPVIRECEERSMPYGVVAHGHIVNEAPARWPMVPLPEKCTDEVIARLLTNLEVGVLVFGSSVHDTLPLTVARHTRKHRIPIVHVLDNWTGYRRRLEHDGLPMLLPDVYTAIDDVAYEGAVNDGIDPAVLRITGHPALASLCRELADGHGGKLRPGPPYQLLFVSEPVEADQGSDASSPGFRGYTESQVLHLLCHALQPNADEVVLSVLPHPRENLDQLRRAWERAKGNLRGTLLAKGKGRQSVLQADGVAGMASLLLYEAWLTGKPVLSVQPGLMDSSLRMLECRSGVHFFDLLEKQDTVIDSWMAAIKSGKGSVQQPDLLLHQLAAGRIHDLLHELCVRQCDMGFPRQHQCQASEFLC